MKRYTFTLEETELAAVRNVQEIFRSKHLIPCTPPRCGGVCHIQDTGLAVASVFEAASFPCSASFGSSNGTTSSG